MRVVGHRGNDLVDLRGGGSRKRILQMSHAISCVDLGARHYFLFQTNDIIINKNSGLHDPSEGFHYIFVALLYNYRQDSSV